MICQKCKKNSATIHLTEIINGQRNERHLCEECAQNDGVTMSTQIPLNELLSNLLAMQPQDESYLNDETDLICPSCQTTMNQIKDQSLLGCPDDYDVFNDSLEKVIDKSQDGSQLHCGKVPQNESRAESKANEMAKLQKLLDEAVKHERYEDAAELRDKIKQLQ